jgi:hypothetical protein
MRLAIVKILQQQLQDFLNVAGIEMQGFVLIHCFTSIFILVFAQY